MIHLDAQKEMRTLAKRAGIAAGATTIDPEVVTVTDRVASICGVVADQGGGRQAMLHAVDKAFRHEPAGLRGLARLLAHRCATIAERHDPEDDDGPGDDIRWAFGDLP